MIQSGNPTRVVDLVGIQSVDRFCTGIGQLGFCASLSLCIRITCRVIHFQPVDEGRNQFKNIRMPRVIFNYLLRSTIPLSIASSGFDAAYDTIVVEV